MGGVLAGSACEGAKLASSSKLRHLGSVSLDLIFIPFLLPGRRCDLGGLLTLCFNAVSRGLLGVG